MKADSRSLLSGLRIFSVVAVLTALWLFSAGALIPLEYLPELSSWGRQFILFSQFGGWAVLLAGGVLTIQGMTLSRAAGMAISWTLLAIFAADLTISFLALFAQARMPAITAFLPQSPPAAYLVLVPGYALTLVLKLILLSPVLLTGKVRPANYPVLVAKTHLFGYTVLLAGLVVGDLPRFLGWR